MEDFFLSTTNLNYFRLNDKCSKSKIETFEQKFNISIPKDFKEFLLFSNGAELINIENNFLPLKNGFKVWNIFQIFSIERIENELLYAEKPYTTIYYDMAFSQEKVESQEQLILIGISDTAYFFIGYTGTFTNKVFIYHHAHGSGDDGIIDEFGWCIYPIRLIANSFLEYLEMLIENEAHPFN